MHFTVLVGSVRPWLFWLAVVIVLPAIGWGLDRYEDWRRRQVERAYFQRLQP